MVLAVQIFIEGFDFTYIDIFYTNYVVDILQKELRAFLGVVMT